MHVPAQVVWTTITSSRKTLFPDKISTIAAATDLALLSKLITSMKCARPRFSTTQRTTSSGGKSLNNLLTAADSFFAKDFAKLAKSEFLLVPWWVHKLSEVSKNGVWRKREKSTYSTFWILTRVDFLRAGCASDFMSLSVKYSTPRSRLRGLRRPSKRDSYFTKLLAQTLNN